ncbi:MAG: hypothetical protein ACREYD_11785 [Casimicrobiaceae bacterium]
MKDDVALTAGASRVRYEGCAHFQAIVASDGWVRVPTGPGLGVEIDREALERFHIE